jgi:SWIM zinc finger
MTQAQYEVRNEHPGNGALIASKTEEGFRVYSLENPSKVYLVREEGERWTCTCPDFEAHQSDTTWRCRHILAVAPWPDGEDVIPPENGYESEATLPAEPPQEPPAPKKRARKQSNGSVQMLIKRSVSPDGRIDSVSVEFSMPVAEGMNDEIKEKALQTLQLQKEIVGAFLKMNGQPAAGSTVQNGQPAAPEKPNGKPVFARLVDIGKVNGKWGERFCINVQVNGRWSRIFGSAEQLADQIAKAGYHIDPQNIDQGLKLNLACLVITKPSDDGKYLNVERVLPLQKRGGQSANSVN